MGHHTCYKQFGSLMVLPILVTSKLQRDWSHPKGAFSNSDLRTGWSTTPDERTLKRFVVCQPCIKRQVLLCGSQLSSRKIKMNTEWWNTLLGHASNSCSKEPGKLLKAAQVNRAVCQKCSSKATQICAFLWSLSLPLFCKYDCINLPFIFFYLICTNVAAM